MIEHSPELGKLILAVHRVQGAVGGVKKDAKNPHFKNRYATLEAVIDAARPALQANGMAFTQAPGAIVDGAVEITTMLMHTSGEWLRSTLHVPLAKRDAQGVGSAITYGCRYSLMAALGLPPVDDDGQAAVAPAKAPDAPAKPLGPAYAEGENPADMLQSEIDRIDTAQGVIDFMQDPRTARTLTHRMVIADAEAIRQYARNRIAEIREEVRREHGAPE